MIADIFHKGFNERITPMFDEDVTSTIKATIKNDL